MAKRADARYESGRTSIWLKLKCQQRQEFVAIGFTDPSGGRAEVGSLLLSYHDHGQLRYGSFGHGLGPPPAASCTSTSADRPPTSPLSTHRR